jgi:LPS-assembly protein
MPILKIAVFVSLLLNSVLNFSAHAMDDKKTLHRSADREVWDRKSNRVELFGKARVVQPGEILIADYILLDLNTRDVEAKGNCIYSAADSVIFSDEMKFNLNTRSGTILNGRVTNDRFSLTGERIDKLGADRYKTHWGEYTTCQDCPNSWSFLAEDVDMQIEGYAYLTNVTTKIKDASAFWLPYIVIPIKTRRQTGLLFPKLLFASNTGLSGVLPFFWTLGRSADVTIGLGQYSRQGLRVELEGRYSLSERSGGRAAFNYLGDREFINKPHRWTLDVAQGQELPWGFEQKLRIMEVSDNKYPIFYPNDIPRGTEKYLNSDFILSHSSSHVSAFIDFRRSRNIFNTDSDPVNRDVQFDPNTVQLAPAIIVTTNDKLLFDSAVATGVTVGLSSFTRTNAAFDDGVNVGDPQIIRKATRFSLNPSIYTTFRPFDVLTVIPSIQVRDYFYTFHNESGLDNLNRGYLLFQTDLSTQLEKIYETGDPDYPKKKHLIRPVLTYSIIPLKSENGHRFVTQIENGVGYNFDNYDVIPMNATADRFDYFVPFGHSLVYGVSTQLVRRKGAIDAPDASYMTNIEWSVGQAINFLEFNKAAGQPSQPFSRLVSNLLFNTEKFLSNSTYYYYPYRSGFRHYFSTGNTFIIERSMHQRILAFDRSVTLNYSIARSDCTVGNFCPPEGYFLSSVVSMGLNYSVSDYILPTFGMTYNLTSSQIASGTVGVQFQSPSQCWRFGVSTTLNRVNDGIQAIYGIDFSLNLTGSGFGGISEVANQAIGSR